MRKIVIVLILLAVNLAALDVYILRAYKQNPTTSPENRVIRKTPLKVGDKIQDYDVWGVCNFTYDLEGHMRFLDANNRLISIASEGKDFYVTKVDSSYREERKAREQHTGWQTAVGGTKGDKIASDYIKQENRASFVEKVGDMYDCPVFDANSRCIGTRKMKVISVDYKKDTDYTITLIHGNKVRILRPSKV